MMRSKAYGRLKRRKARWGYLFVLPWMLGFLFFFAAPVIQSLWYSLSDIKMSDTGFALTWVGMDNYAFMLLKDSRFVPLMTDAVLEMLYKVPLIVILSLFIAVLLNQKFRGKGLFRSVFFLPVIITSGVTYVMLQGIINGNTLGATQNAYIFQSAGLREAMLGASLPLWIVNFINDIVNRVFALIMESGVQILLFLSGLQKIPPSTYEAARMEGAGEWDSFWKITVPQMVPIMLLNVVYSIIDSFLAYGTEETGNRVMAAIYRMGFGSQFQFGLAASMSWIYMAVITLILLLTFGVLGRLAKRMEE
jgi:ABC-type sugar transport system permease subunit